MELNIEDEVLAINNALEALIDSLPDLIADHIANTPSIPFELPESVIDEVIAIAKDANNEVRLKVLDRMRDLVNGPSDLDAADLQKSFDEVLEFYIRKTAQESANRIQSAHQARQVISDRKAAITKAVEVSKRVVLDVSESEIYASAALFSIATSLENGYSYFRYETSQDEVVRHTHKDRQGKIFIYGKQRVTADVPSLEHNCRCFDFPLSDEEVLSNLDKFYYPEDAPSGVGAKMDLKITASHVEVIGSIDEWDGNDFTTFKRKVLGALSGEETLKLSITSHGGDAFAGMAAYSFLKGLPNRVETSIYGHAGSAATHFVAASDHVSIGESDVILIHSAKACFCGTKEEMGSVSEQLGTVDESQVLMYVEKTGRTEEEVRELMNKDQYITAQAALEFGLVDEIRADSTTSADARKAYKGKINVLAQAHNQEDFMSDTKKEQLEQEIADLKAEKVDVKAAADIEIATALATITALEGQLEEANNIDIDAKVAEKLEAEKAEIEELATAKERVTALGREPKGDTALEVYTQATKDMGTHEEGYEEAQVLASFNAFEKASPTSGTALGASFIAKAGEGSKEGETRAERAKRLEGGS